MILFPKIEYGKLIFFYIYVGTSVRKKRGPTTMKEVHSRIEEDQKAIFLNELNQPIGPVDNTVNEFSNFLETLAKTETLTPMIVNAWPQMLTKESLWEYAQVNSILFFLLSSSFFLINFL